MTKIGLSPNPSLVHNRNLNANYKRISEFYIFVFVAFYAEKNFEGVTLQKRRFWSHYV